MNKMNKKGFTLIEMLVVIAIIAVLVAIIVPTVSSSTAKAKAATDAANLRTIAAEAAIDYMDDEKLSQNYEDAATCKSIDGAKVQVLRNATTGEIQAVFTKDSKNYSVKSFADVADGTATTVEEATLTGFTAAPVKTK